MNLDKAREELRQAALGQRNGESPRLTAIRLTWAIRHLAPQSEQYEGSGETTLAALCTAIVNNVKL